MGKVGERQTEETILGWLSDAHLMEGQSLRIFQELQQRLQHYPRIADRIAQYLFATRTQEEVIRRCLRNRTLTSSTIKDLDAWMSALGIKPLDGNLPDDEVMRAVLSGYSFLHMKIAVYEMLIEGANTLDDRHTLEVCQSHLEREFFMAGWLYDNMRAITSEFLHYSLVDGSNSTV